MATITWKGVTGDWATAGDWLGGKTPGAADAALINGSKTFSLTMGEAQSLAGVDLADANATLTLNDSLSLGGTFTLNSGGLVVDQGGEVSGGTIRQSGGSIVWNSGTLNGVTVEGGLDLSGQSAEVVVTNGLTLTGAAGNGSGTVNLSGYNSVLEFSDSQTVTNATIDMGNPNNFPVAELEFSGAGNVAAALTLGPGLVIDHAGRDAQIYTGTSALNTIVNQGQIEAETAFFNGSMLINGIGAFVNQGTITVANGDYLGIAAASFINTGLITVASSGTIDLDGHMTTAGLGNVVNSGGTILFGGGGSLNNAGAVLSLGSGTALGSVYVSDTITGGTIVDKGSGFIARQAHLNGVKFEGELDMSSAGSFLIVNNGIKLTGAGGAGAGDAELTGSGSYLRFYGDQTLSNAKIDIGASGGRADLQLMDLADTGVTLNLASNLTVNHAGGNALILTGYFGADTIVSQGKINATSAGGGYVQIGGAGDFINSGTITVSNADYLAIASGAFSNSGVVTVSGGGTLGLDTSLTTASLAGITNAGGTVTVGGTLLSSSFSPLAGTIVNTGATLTVGSGSELGQVALKRGAITGGVVIDGGSGLLTQGGTLSGVKFEGTLGMAASYAALTVTNGLTLTGAGGSGWGTINLTGSGSLLDLSGSQTLSGATVNLGYASGNRPVELAIDDPGRYGATLTLASSVTLTHAGGRAQIFTGDGANDTIISNGRINATSTAFVGNYLLIEGSGEFINQGTINVGGKDSLTVTCASFANAGAIDVAANAALNLEGALVTADIGSIHNTGGTVTLGGLLDNSGATLAIGSGSALGEITLTSGTISGGTIADGGGGLVTQNGTLSGVTFEGSLDLSAANTRLNITNGLTLTGAGGVGPGQADLTGSNSVLDFYGSQTLTNGTIDFGNAAGSDPALLEVADLGASGVTLTLGAGVVINHAGSHADLKTGNFSDDAIVNQGVINAAGGYFGVIGAGTLVNQGTMNFSKGDVAAVASTAFTNAGLIDVNGADVILYGAVTNFAGTTLNGGTFQVSGTSTLLAPTGDIVGADNATVILSGTGSVIETYNPTTEALETLDASLKTIASAGTLQLLGGRNWSSTKSMTNAGHILLGGVSFAAAGLVNRGTVNGHGALTGTIINDGLIEAASGTLSLAGAVLTNLSASLMTGGTLEAASSAVVQLAANDPIATLAGGVILNGAGSEVQSLKTSTSIETTLEASLTSIAATGALDILDNRGFAAKAAIVNAGVIDLSGGTLSGAALTDAASSTLTGHGAVALAITDNGVTDSVGGALAFRGQGDSFTGVLEGSEIEFTGGTDTLTGVDLTASTTKITSAAGVTLSGSIELTRTLSAAGAIVTIAAAGATIGGGGTVSLSNSAANVITGAVAGAQLTLASGRIIGAGQLGDGELQIVNDGTIEAQTSTALVINTGSSTLINAGLVESVSSGGLTITGAVANSGMLTANKGTLVVGGAVTGTGSVRIDGGAAEFSAAFSQGVSFGGSAGSVLQLADSRAYSGVVSGFSKTGGTTLDLLDIAFGGKTVATWSGSTTSGVLTVTDGTHTAAIHLTGNYTASTFSLSSDGKGGTLVVDLTTAKPATLIAAMAGFAQLTSATESPAERHTTADWLLSRPAASSA